MKTNLLYQRRKGRLEYPTSLESKAHKELYKNS